MGAGLEMVVVAASLGSALAAAPLVAKGEPVMLVQVVELGAADDTELAPFLRERLQATWPGLRAFAEHPMMVRIVQTGADRFEVAIVLDRGVWAERTFAAPANDRVVERLAVWLFVRSTLTRLLAERSPAAGQTSSSDSASAVPGATPFTPPPPPASSPSPPHAATVASAASASTGGPTPVASPAPVAAVPSSTSTSAVDKVSSSSSSLAWTLLATSTVAPHSLSLVGVSLGADWRWRADAVAAAAVGYAYGSAGDELALHRAQARLVVSTSPWQPVPLDVGLSAGFELELARSPARTRGAYGADLGPLVSWHLPLAEPLALSARLGLLWELVRHRYVLAHGASTESPWAASAGVGVQWQ